MMGPCIMGSFIMGRDKEKGNCCLLIKVCMRGIGVRINRMGLEDWCILLVKFMLVIGSKGSLMEKA